MTNTRGSLAYRLLRVAPVLMLLLIPFAVSGRAQSSVASTTGADDILKQESYAPPHGSWPRRSLRRGTSM